MWDEEKVLSPTALWMGCPGRAARARDSVSHEGSGGAAAAMGLVSQVCDRGLPKDRTEGPTARFASLAVMLPGTAAPGLAGTVCLEGSFLQAAFWSVMDAPLERVRGLGFEVSVTGVLPSATPCPCCPRLPPPHPPRPAAAPRSPSVPKCRRRGFGGTKTFSR